MMGKRKVGEDMSSYFDSDMTDVEMDRFYASWSERARIRASNRAARTRGPNFSEEENNLLISLVPKFRHIIESKNTTTVSIRKKRTAWNMLAKLFNAASDCAPRTVDALREKYCNLKRRNRTEAADLGEKMDDMPTLIVLGPPPPGQQGIQETRLVLPEKRGYQPPIPSHFDSQADDSVNMESGSGSIEVLCHPDHVSPVEDHDPNGTDPDLHEVPEPSISEESGVHSRMNTRLSKLVDKKMMDSSTAERHGEELHEQTLRYNAELHEQALKFNAELHEQTLRFNSEKQELQLALLREELRKKKEETENIEAV